MNLNDLKVGNKVKVVAIRDGFQNLSSAYMKGYTGTVTEITAQSPDLCGRPCNIAEVEFENGTRHNYFIHDELELVETEPVNPVKCEDTVLSSIGVEGPFVRFRGTLWTKKEVQKKIDIHKNELANFESLLTLFK